MNRKSSDFVCYGDLITRLRAETSTRDTTFGFYIRIEYCGQKWHGIIDEQTMKRFYLIPYPARITFDQRA